jgi:hypothetical protein
MRKIRAIEARRFFIGQIVRRTQNLSVCRLKGWFLIGRRPICGPCGMKR